jgi:hypothetical protein
VLVEPDVDVVWSVLQLHAEKVQKIGSRISLFVAIFVVSMNVMNYRPTCFFVARTDGTVVDFALMAYFARLAKGDETSWRRIMNRLTASSDLKVSLIDSKHNIVNSGFERVRFLEKKKSILFEYED